MKHTSKKTEFSLRVLNLAPEELVLKFWEAKTKESDLSLQEEMARSMLLDLKARRKEARRRVSCAWASVLRVVNK
jgi:hypothetical protein